MALYLIKMFEEVSSLITDVVVGLKDGRAIVTSTVKSVR